MPLTDKQNRFLEEYLIDQHGTRAYRAAYPNCKSDRAAEAAASRLLSNVIIRAEVDSRLAELAKKTRILRALGELKDNVEHTGPGGAPIPLLHTGNVTHDPTLQAADAAFAESLAGAVIDSFAAAGADSSPDGGVHANGAN